LERAKEKNLQRKRSLVAKRANGTENKKGKYRERRRQRKGSKVWDTKIKSTEKKKKV
jgi:hypothetical protein